MPFETGRFRRADRILSSRDFVRAVKTGKRRSAGSFVVVIAPRADCTDGERDHCDQHHRHNRLGVTVSKRVGNSVVRNRVKRRIREWFRHAREALPAGSDIVVIARRTARDLSGCEVAAALDGMARRARPEQAG